jgi:hypothetical protein
VIAAEVVLWTVIWVTSFCIAISVSETFDGSIS